MKFYEKLVTRLYKGIEFERDRDPDNQGIKGFVKRRISPDAAAPQTNISIVLNNSCNLNCFACSAKPNSDRFETSALEVGIFLRNIKRWKSKSAVVFSGGEITLMNPEKLQRIFIATKGNYRKVVILTNGAKLIDLTNVDHVILDDHGSNEKQILKFEQLLIDEKKPYTVRKTIWHRDNEFARRGSITKGARCHQWLNSITLWKRAVYPCCVSCYLDYWDNEDKLRQALMNSGWKYSNSRLSNYIERWRNTLPPLMFKKCMLSCWTDSESNKWGRTY